MSSKKRCLELCDAFKRHKLKFGYRINGRVNIVDEEQLRALKDTGCRAIGYGIESGDQRVLDYMHKKTSIDQIIWAVEATKQYGINVTTPVMFGQPMETLQSLDKTKELLKQLIDGHEEYPRDIRRLTPYPGTEIYQWAVKNGKLKNEEHFFEIFKGAHQSGFNLTNLSDEDFEAHLKSANEEVVAVWKEKRKSMGLL
jgi:anaerobic magnesium-protoporphyrin IX monomethyl ester cyclase